MFVGGTPLGFRIMVDPINQNGKAWNKMSPNVSQTRSLQGQLGGNAPQVGTGLRSCLRTVLEQQEMSPENIETCL